MSDKDNKPPVGKDDNAKNGGQPDSKAGDGAGKEEKTVALAALQEERKKRQDLEKKLADFEKTKSDAENSSLEEQKKFEDLYKKTLDEKTALEGSLEESKKNTVLRDKRLKLLSEATKAGATDPQDVLPFVKLDEIDLETGDFETPIKALLEKKPYLFGAGKEQKTDPRLNGSAFLKKDLKNSDPKEVADSLLKDGLSANFNAGGNG